jgi:hypothetical protein
MKTLAFAALWTLLLTAPTFGQTSAKPVSPAAAGLGKVEGSSNVDRNIRAYIELLRSDLKSSKSQIMGEVMQLNTDQATKFWPIYKEFESDYAGVGDRIVGVVTKYADEVDSMTDAKANQLGEQVLSIEQQRNELKKKYYDRVKEALGGIIAMRFLQVENQLERIVDLQIAAGLPIVESK